METKIMLFGSSHCPDNGPATDILDERNVEYTYIDITSDMPSLKMFLKMRDKSPAYAELRGGDTIGIPCLQVDDVEYVIDGPEHLERIINGLGARASRPHQ
ncbi:MAG: hypothetical protein FWE91_10525 [Defluviitaleaceae bacterium]|nr:hypothetical protein [Defluviitaleaceae bacterium]MCL2837153.1 hypothetical protein [Defluviitaleaceae bacterium]